MYCTKTIEASVASRLDVVATFRFTRTAPKQILLNARSPSVSTRPIAFSVLTLTTRAFLLHALPLLQHDAIHTSLHQCIDTGDFPLQEAQTLGDFQRDGPTGEVCQCRRELLKYVSGVLVLRKAEQTRLLHVFRQPLVFVQHFLFQW